MAIIRSRDELIPVTCAVLKDDVREAFFKALKNKVGGRVERIAKACGVTTATVNDWAKGSTNPPYHTLQKVAEEFGLDAPLVSELRREFQQVNEAAKPTRTSVTNTKPTSQNPPAPPTEHTSKRAQHRRRKSPESKNDSKTVSAHSSIEKPTDERAYWSGVLLARASRDDSRLRLKADRQMSQNFAATWAILTVKAFGVKPELSMSEDRLTQTAELPADKIVPFLDRLDFRPGTNPTNAPGAPRWAWSNPSWKINFLKGLVDASAHFHRSPALKLTGLSEKAAKSANKLLVSSGFTPKEEEGHTIVLEGREALKKYLEDIGTDNAKLKDQLNAFFKGIPETPAKTETASARQRPTRSRRQVRSRRRHRKHTSA